MHIILGQFILCADDQRQSLAKQKKQLAAALADVPNVSQHQDHVGCSEPGDQLEWFDLMLCPFALIVNLAVAELAEVLVTAVAKFGGD